jgi:hypothetical protein
MEEPIKIRWAEKNKKANEYFQNREKFDFNSYQEDMGYAKFLKIDKFLDLMTHTINSIQEINNREKRLKFLRYIEASSYFCIEFMCANQNKDAIKIIDYEKKKTEALKWIEKDDIYVNNRTCINYLFYLTPQELNNVVQNCEAGIYEAAYLESKVVSPFENEQSDDNDDEKDMNFLDDIDDVQCNNTLVLMQRICNDLNLCTFLHNHTVNKEESSGTNEELIQENTNLKNQQKALADRLKVVEEWQKSRDSEMKSFRQNMCMAGVYISMLISYLSLPCVIYMMIKRSK